MTNNMIDIVSDYEYVIGQVQGNVLNLQAQFGGMGWAREELYIISKELENTGKMFAEKQGLRKTGTLIDSTHAVVDDNHHINFFNNANLGNGFYAGHIEYGHHTRNGEFVPARPFMRPALYAVAEASKGKLAGALSRYLNQVVYGRMSLNTLEFGRAQSNEHYTRVFYQQQTLGRGAASNTGHYTTSGLQNSQMNRQSAFGQMSSVGHRGVMSPIIAERDIRGRVIQMGNADRFMTQNPTYSRHGTTSTRRYQYYDKHLGRSGRPSEGKARIPSGKGPGRPREYAPGNQPSRQSTGKPRGRPAIYSDKSQWPSKQKKYDKPGRPRIYSDKSQWPSRQRKYDKPGRPRKNKTEKKTNPYNHKRIKKDITSSKSTEKYMERYNKGWEKKSNWDLKGIKAVKESPETISKTVSIEKRSDYKNIQEFAQKKGLSLRADREKNKKTLETNGGLK